MQKMFFTLFISIALQGYAVGHPIKMSTGKVTYDRVSKKVTVVINFFIDDFGAQLAKIYRQRGVDFSAPTAALHDLVNDYVSKKVILKMNGARHALALEGLSTLEANVVQAKFSIAAPVGFKIDVLEIYNELLFEAFKDQVNIFYVDLEGKGDADVFRFSVGDAYALLKVNFVCR